MRRFKKLLASLLAVAMLASMGTVVMAKDVEQDSVLIQKVNHMIGNVANNAEQMGMSGADFDNLYLGERAHYENGVSFYPVFQGESGPQVATIETWIGESGQLTVQFESGVTKVLANNPPVTNGNVTKLYAISTYATTSNRLNVPVVGQGTSSGNMLCWAACTSAVASYLGKGYMSPINIAMSIGKNDTSGATLTDISAALSYNYGIRSSYYSPSGLYIDTIVSSINNNKPIITKVGYTEEKLLHSVALVGYIYDNMSRNHYVNFMDPDGYGAIKTVSIADGENFNFYYKESWNPDGLSPRYTFGYLLPN